MRPIRALIVDDSAVVRRLVSKVLTEDPDIEVVGKAIHGYAALEQIERLQPDVVIIDIEMPVMDGMELLSVLRLPIEGLKVIMFSSMTRHGAKATIEALSLGAADYVPKPSQSNRISDALDVVRRELVPRIKGLCWEPSTSRSSSHPAPSGDFAAFPAEVIAIGCSTGGPKALAEVLPRLSGNLDAPILVVQHMPAEFVRELASSLDRKSSLSVQVAEEGDVLGSGGVWIAPGDHHMEVARGEDGIRLSLNQDPPENSTRPAVDPLFRSLASACGARSLGIVLTGMGVDGRVGAEAIREAGGRVLVQDEPSSVVWGMPGAVANAGLANAVLALEGLASAIGACALRPSVVSTGTRRERRTA